MAKRTQSVKVVLEDRGAYWFAAVLGDDSAAALGDDPQQALDNLRGVVAHVLRHFPGGVEDQGEHVARHLRLTVPATRLGRMLQLDLQLFAVCVEAEDGYVVHLPQLGIEFPLKDLEELELMAAEFVRDNFPLPQRIESLVHCVAPLVNARDDGTDSPVFRVETLAVRYTPEPSEVDILDDDVSPTLAAVGEPLHRRARQRDGTRAFERRAEVDTLLDYLSDTAERSVVLVGPPGVGKTAIVHEAVRRIVEGEGGDVLKGAGVWQISGGRLMAGMRYLGQWQERVLDVINEARESGALLFVENLLELLETSGTERHASGIPGLLLPHVLAGDITLVTEVQPDQLARIEQSHPSFLRAFRRLIVEPMSAARADAVLERVSFRLGRQYGVRLDGETRQRILELVGRFKGPTSLPGPAVELAERMARTHARHGEEVEGEDRPVLTPRHALEAYTSLTGLPEALLDPNIQFDVARVRAYFEARIFAQPEAVEAMVDLVTTIRAGLNSPQRPLGSFLFLGPTGVGKTQTALTLANYLFGSADRLARFDMSEFQDSWAAGRLVGRYRGEQGELVRRVREQPFQVILLDEIEKAHSNVFDFLLQVLGEGRLTDGVGHTVSLTSSVVIMTSNLGAGGPPSVGFSARTPDGAREAEVSHFLGAVEKFFRPEFVGRIDRVIPFRSLGHDTAHQLVRAALRQAFEREGLKRRRIRVRATDDVVEFLIRVGLDERYGARPLRRAVENHITAPLGQFLSRESGIVDIDLVFRMEEGLPTIDLDAG